MCNNFEINAINVINELNVIMKNVTKFCDCFSECFNLNFFVIAINVRMKNVIF